MEKLLISIYIFLFATAAIAQDELMVYGKARLPEGVTDSIFLKANSHTDKNFEKEFYLTGKGEYRLFFKYNDTYTISFTKDGYFPMVFELSTIFPEGKKACCQTPIEISFHMIEPGSEFDSIFEGSFLTIEYDQKLKGYNHDIDIDYTAQKMLIDAELNKQNAIKDSARRKEIADSIAVEREYLRIINQGNLYFAAQNWAKSKQMFLKAMEIKPGRRYPKYKLEDIKTAVELFNKKELSAPINLDSVTVPENIPEPEKHPVFVYTPPSDEEIERRLNADIVTQIKKEETNDSVIAARISYISEIIDEKIEPQAPVLLETKKERAEISSFEVPEPAVKEAISKPEQAEETALNLTDSLASDSLAPIMSADRLRKNIPNSEVFFDENKYQDSLQAKYPDFKTVEIEENMYKKTTRVFINKDQRVTIYMKVEHAWGGVFYFIDRTPFPPENISPAFYESETRSVDRKAPENE